MSKALLMNFAVDKGNKQIKVEREFAAELPLVWRAWTDSEILDQWWAPKPWKSRTKSMDFREGGHWHYAMVGPEGEEHWGLTNYKTIDPKKRFTALDGFADAEGVVNTEMPQSKWEVSFTPKEEVTLVENLITFDDLAQLETTIQMGFKEGLTMAMENLDSLLAAQKQEA